MNPLSSVNWGPSDALKHDEQFSLKWIEPPSIKACLLKKHWLISGEKGSGKSAIRRALAEIYGDKFIATPVVDFDNITFRALYENIVELAKATKLSKTTTLSHYWQYAMVIELVVACATAKPERYGEFLNRLPTSRTRIPLSERLLRVLEDAWNKIDAYTGQRPQKRSAGESAPANLLASLGLTAKLLADLSQFPLGREFVDTRHAFFSKLEEHNEQVVLILDGFDTLRNDGAPADAIRLIFDSLVNAIQSINAYQDLPTGLAIKAFIPHDRYLSLSLRDVDKVDTMHAAIRWNGASLQEFLKKRLQLALKSPGGTFHDLWRQVVPEKVFNLHYKIEEDSFDYVLRHTMMRPRQLQIHLEHLASAFQDQVVDPSGIPKSISESSKAVAKHFINEFQTDHPNLDRFIGLLHGKNNIIEFRELRKIVSDALWRFQSTEDTQKIEQKVDTLYTMGFFGVLHFVQPGEVVGDLCCLPTKESTRHYVDFFFKNPHPAISSTLKDESLIAFHPIFVDHASFRPHPTLIVG